MVRMSTVAWECPLPTIARFDPTNSWNSLSLWKHPHTLLLIVPPTQEKFTLTRFPPFPFSRPWRQQKTRKEPQTMEPLQTFRHLGAHHFLARWSVTWATTRLLQTARRICMERHLGNQLLPSLAYQDQNPSMNNPSIPLTRQNSQYYIHRTKHLISS